MGKNIIRNLKEKDVGSIGIGAMIVFIAMVLVAGIAASVLIQTSTTLESQAMLTGEATTKEVSAGINVINIEGHNTSGAIDNLAIMVRPRAGSNDIDLGETVIEISDSESKNILILDTTECNQPADTNGDVLNDGFSPESALQFGIIVMEDADGSCDGTSFVINSGDTVILTVDTGQCFGSLSVRDDVWGYVIPEEGSPGVISFRVPSSLTTAVVELQ